METKLESIVISSIPNQPQGGYIPEKHPLLAGPGPYENLGTGQRQMQSTVINTELTL